MKPEEQEYSSKNILANGNRRYEDHDYASALECAERAIKENQQDKDAWLLKGISLREMGRVYEAIKCLNAAISLDKLFYYAYIENCAAHLALDEIDQASKCVAEALKIHPRSSNAYGWKGFVEFFSGQYRSAITSFRQAIKYEQKERCANFRTNIGDALSSLEEYDKALDCYATASQLDKRDALPIIGVASIFLEKYKDKERADKKFSEAIELDPNAVYAYWIDLGVRLQKEGKDEEAIDYFNKALASDSQFKSLALINKGLICFIKNDYIASINLFESAIGYVSNYSPIAIICKSLALSKAGDFEAAVECYRGAYEFGIAFQNLLPKEVIYKSNLGILYFFKCFDTSLLDSLITESQRTFVNEGIDAPSKGFEPKENEIQKETLSEANQTSMSDEVFSNILKSADENGWKGESIINNYLNFLKKSGQILNFGWISNSEKFSAYDFCIVDLENERFLIDVKSTSGEFDQRIFISQGELRQIAFGIERYDIYRVYDIKNQIPKLRISRDIRDFGKTILDVFRKLPEGITPYVISISPTSMKFDSEIYLKDFD